MINQLCRLTVLYCNLVMKNILANLQGYLKKSTLVEPNALTLKRHSKHDSIPLATLQCRQISDICTSIKFCNENNIDFVLSSSGINPAATSIRSNSLVLDVSPLKNMSHTYGPDGIRISFQAGVIFSEIQQYLHAINCQNNVGYAMPYAEYRNISGIGAHTIMGNGLFHRKCGVAVDLIQQAKVVLSNGELVTANSQQNSDLLWGVKGCGPNMGAIVQITEYLPQKQCNFLDPSFKEQIRTNYHSFLLSQQTLNIGQDIYQAFKHLKQNQFPYIIFSKNKTSSVMHFLNYQMLYDNKQKKINYQRNGKMIKIINDMVVKYKEKSNIQTEVIDKAKGKSSIKSNFEQFYYYIWGGSTTLQYLPTMIKEMLIFYEQNSLEQFQGKTFFNSFLTSLDCQAFQARDSSQTSWPTLKDQGVFIYFQMAYSLKEIKPQVTKYMQRFQDIMKKHLKFGSACDFNYNGFNQYAQGKWIYRQNYDRLKRIREKYDPLNKFGKGLF